MAEEAVWRFADALAWNWLIAGTDAHAKNYSLLLAPGQVRLAPLYDVASALPYGAHERKLRLAMKIGESHAVYPGHDDWPAAAGAPGVKAIAGDLPARLVDLIADRSRRCLELLDRRSDQTD